MKALVTLLATFTLMSLIYLEGAECRSRYGARYSSRSRYNYENRYYGRSSSSTGGGGGGDNTGMIVGIVMGSIVLVVIVVVVIFIFCRQPTPRK